MEYLLSELPVVTFPIAQQEIWVNAYETRDSIGLIANAGCLGPVISAKIHSKYASKPEIAKNSLDPLFWGFKVV